MKIRIALTICVLSLSLGCASIGSSFIKLSPDFSDVPEAELRAAAVAIETAVVQEVREPQLGDFPGVVLDAPEITQALRTRAARYALVKKFLASGHACEQQNGTIKIINSQEYKKSATPRERDQNALLVMSENQSRWALYEGIMKASNWPSGALGAVQQSFYEARVALLEPGDKYEDAEGGMVAK